MGDVGIVDEKWGPSIGLFQIRALRNPHSFSAADNWRIAFALRHPDYNATAAYVISRSGTDWTPWSAYKSGSYEAHVGKDFEIRTGHSRSDQWNL